MADSTLRHRLLASPVRAELLARLHGSGTPMGVRDLASTLDLHPNTVREHLDRLVQAGLARVESEPPRGRGRPPLRYVAAGALDDDAEPAGYRALATALVDQLGATDDPGAASEAAGERWGGRLAAPLAPVAQADAVDRLLELLDQAGFEPETPVALGQPIRLRACPFIALARERRDVVCGIHLGMMRGVLRGLGAPANDVALDPFVAPDLCIAHLGARPDA
jgi:predicted ArsR family transcriptional regulator